MATLTSQNATHQNWVDNLQRIPKQRSAVHDYAFSSASAAAES